MKGKLFVLFFYVFSLFILHNSFAQESIRYGAISEGYRAFEQSGKMGFMNSKGDIVLPPQFDVNFTVDSLPKFKEGLCMFFEKPSNSNQEENDYLLIGFLNHNFQKVISAQFLYKDFPICEGFPNTYSNGFIIVPEKKNSPNNDYCNYQIIDRTGKRIGSPFHYYNGCTAACIYYPEISEGFSVIQNQKGSGYIEVSTGKIVIPYKYSLAGPFSGGVAAVEVDKTYITLINKLGNTIITSKFYTIKKGASGPSLYSNDIGCNYLGGFVNGKMILQYYDNGGIGPHVIALIDKFGNVLNKKEVSEETDDELFKPYQWRVGQE